MGYVPPPIRLSNAEIDRRIAGGARTLREIDPEFSRWLDGRQRFYAVAAVVLIAGLGLLLTCICLTAWADLVRG